MQTAIVKETVALAGATTDFDASDMTLWSAAAGRRQGELTGGERGRALVEAADSRMKAQGVRDPAKYCGMLAPGYRPQGASSE